MKIITEVTKTFNVSLSEEDAKKLLNFLGDTKTKQDDLESFANELYGRLENVLDGGEDL